MGAVSAFIIGAASAAIIIAGAVSAGSGGNEPPKEVYAFDADAIVETAETPSATLATD